MAPYTYLSQTAPSIRHQLLRKEARVAQATEHAFRSMYEAAIGAETLNQAGKSFSIEVIGR